MLKNAMPGHQSVDMQATKLEHICNILLEKNYSVWILIYEYMTKVWKDPEDLKGNEYWEESGPEGRVMSVG